MRKIDIFRDIFRWILTIGLIFLVHMETGMWTAFTLFLISVAFELSASISEKQKERILDLENEIIELKRFILLSNTDCPNKKAGGKKSD